MLTAPDLRKRINFDIFSKFSKIHETYWIYWNHLQKNAYEIWNSLEKFQFLTEKCRQRRTLEKIEILTFLKVLQNSWNLQNLLESPQVTCMCNLKQFGEVSIFDRKMPTEPDLRKRMKFWHFLKVLQNSWNLQNLLESLPGKCIWNLKQFGEVSILDKKMPTAPDLRKRMKFWHFLKVLRNSWNYQNLLESPLGTCMWNLKQFGEVSIFDRKMPTAPDLRKNWNFDISQSSPKFMKLTEFIGITSRNMHVQFEAVWRSFNFWQKNADSSPDLRKRMKFWHFSKFSEIHETYRIYWNHLQEHACEIWSSLEKFQFLTEKCRQRRTLEKGWTFDIFSKVSKIHETYRIYWDHLQEHACAIWSSLEKFQFLTEKCQLHEAPDLRKRMKFWHFSKFSEIHETYRIYWNHLQEHACAIWSSLEKFFLQKNANSAGP